MKRKYKASYDGEGDVLTIYDSDKPVKESIEVTDDLIIDIDKNDQLVNLELIDAYKFLNTFNGKISKSILDSISEVELEFKNYRNYWFITLSFKHNNHIIIEKLPAFANTDFKSPLIASAAA
ncbi:MAG: DUF2283 domain-containing protein [Nanoarchaeota archaeon]|nr:DUF2283 domain-containing protein [Nanoarchaeota archaeon]